MHSIASLVTVLSAAMLSTVSAAPLKSHAGKICVSSGSKHEGYVNSQLSSTGEFLGLYTLTTNAHSALEVKFAGSGDITIQETNGDNAFPYLAFIEGPGDANTGNLVAGAFSYVYLGGAKVTTPGGSAPVVTESSAGALGVNKGVETGLWSYDSPPSLAPHWINSSSQGRQRYGFYDPENKFFGITGDLSQQQDFSPKTYEVTFSLC